MTEPRTADGAIERTYRRYLSCVNAHAFEHLGTFVAPDVRVNGEACGLVAYECGLAHVIHAFPDYNWHLDQMIVQGNWLSARFTDTGTHNGPFLGVPASGKKITTFELAFYRFEGGKIAEVWVTADKVRVMCQIAGRDTP